MRNPGMGSNFLHVNRNKRSLVLNLKKADGLAAFFKLVETADVVVYNIRPQAMARLGIDYERPKPLTPSSFMQACMATVRKALMRANLHTMI